MKRFERVFLADARSLLLEDDEEIDFRVRTLMRGIFRVSKTGGIFSERA